MQKVVIYIPNLGDISTKLVRILLQLKNIEVVMPEGIVPHDNARNYCVHDFLKRTNNPDDVLVFIDSDIVPNPGDIQKLIQYNTDIVGALCLVQKEDAEGIPTPVPMALRLNKKNEYKVFFDGTSLTEVDATGSGLIAIKRKVFTAIGDKPYQFISDGIGNIVKPEDFYFCEKAKALDFKVYVDYNILADHIKTVSLNGINRLLIKNHD